MSTLNRDASMAGSEKKTRGFSDFESSTCLVSPSELTVAAPI